MRRVMAGAFVLLALASSGCFDDKVEDACTLYCQKAGECMRCGGDVDIDGCVEECKALPLDAQKKLPDCYKGECENIYICSDIIGQEAPSPCAD